MTTKTWNEDLSVIPTNPYRDDDDENSQYGHLFKSLAEYLAEQPEDGQEWIIKGFLPKSYLTILGGLSKDGKSVFTTAMVMAVVTGNPFLGMETQQGAVLWLAFEESEGERREILKLYQVNEGDLFTTHEKLYIDSAEGMSSILYWVRRTKAILLVVDPLYGACQAESLNDGRKARETLAGLKELCRTENLSAWVLHHMNKNVQSGMTRERMADSNQILATASNDFLFESDVQEDGSRKITLHGRGRGTFANQIWNIRSESETHFELLSSGKSNEGTRVAILVDLETSGQSTAEEMAARLKLNPKSLKNRLTELNKAGKIIQAGRTSSNAIIWAVSNDGMLHGMGEESSQ
jgi:hypothetical protein